MATSKCLSWNIDLEDWQELDRLCSSESIAKSVAGGYSKADLPDEVDYRPYIRIENQFSIGSCQGNSISTSTEICVYLDTGMVVQLTRMGAYIWTQELDGIRGDNGSTVSNGIKVALKGLCLEEYWPYPKEYSRVPMPPATKEQAEANRSIRLKKFYRLRTLEDVVAWIESNQGPIHCGFSWVTSLSRAGAVVESYSGQSAGGHSVTLAGFKTRNGDRLPRLFNSHSLSYGDKGTTLLSLRCVEQMTQDRNVVMIGVATSEGLVAPRYDYLSKPVTR